MGLRIAHVNVRVVDLARSISFYRLLGLEVSGCLQLGEDSTLVYMAAPADPNLALELAAHHRAGPGWDRSPGSGHLALAVGDLEEMVARLRQAGAKLEVEPHHPGGRDDLYVAFIRDPDGVRVELIDGPFSTPQDELPAELRGIGGR